MERTFYQHGYGSLVGTYEIGIALALITKRGMRHLAVQRDRKKIDLLTLRSVIFTSF